MVTDLLTYYQTSDQTKLQSAISTANKLAQASQKTDTKGIGNTLVSSSKQINNGIQTLNTKAPNLKQLSTGAKTLNSGVAKLKTGSTELSKGLETLSVSSKQVKDGVNKLNNGANVVTIYKKDSKGNYNTPVKAMICSIGDATPEKGVYKMSDKYTWRLLQGDVYGQYAYRITGHILFHSVPYKKQSKSSLEWWEYDKLGTDASLGCIRLTVEDAKWIYDNCPKGTQVEFYYSSDPGPLGKPTAKKISSYSEELKKWDPTDPDSKNPWKTYVETGAPSQGDTTETGTQPVSPTGTNPISDNI